MKKIFLVSIVSGLALAGCGGGSSTNVPPQTDKPLSVKIEDSNQLHIKTLPSGSPQEHYDNTVKLTAENTTAKFYAIANDPVSYVEIYPLAGATLPAGWISLDSKTLRPNISFLAFADGDQSLSLRCSDGGCDNASSYSLTTQGDRSVLDLRFNNASNKLHAKTPQNWLYNLHFYSGGSLGKALIDLNDHIYRQVEISGRLGYSIPSDWAIMQAQRFPVIDVQGSFVVAGESYRVQEIGRGIVGRTGITLDQMRLHTISLKSESGKQASFVVAPILESSLYPDAKLYVALSTDKGSFEAFLPASQAVWTEDAQTMRASFNQFVLKASLFGEQTESLTTNLVIPKVYSQLSFNNQLLTLSNYDGKSAAFVRNNQKNYSVQFAQDEKSYDFTLSREGNSILAVQYEIAGQTYRCGSETLTCSGLTLDADQKTYRFNNVKLGSHTLNGSVFIPGVFE